MAVASLNARTMANIIAGSNDPLEVAWLMQAHNYGRGLSPISNWFGALGGGRPIMEVLDTRRVKGKQIVATVKAGLGQRGRQGSGSRADKAEKYKSRDYRVTVGMMHHAVAIENAAKDATVIGSEFDKSAAPDLSEWMHNKQHCDVLAELHARAHSRNTFRPNNKADTNALTSNDTFGLNSVTDIKEGMYSIGAAALSVKKGPNGERTDCFYVQGTQFLFAELNRNAQYTAIRASAENRGAANSVFAGGKPLWDNVILNQWDIKTHDWDAPQGARSMPMAILGKAIAANPVNSDVTTCYIYGGGNATSADNTEVDYFENFKGSGYLGFEGEKIAATTDTEYYLAIKSKSGANNGKIRLFAYQVNNGNRITLTRALSSTNPGGTSLKFTTLSATAYTGKATWDDGDWVAADYLTEAEMPIGSLIYQCNIRGQCLCYGYGIGSRMMMAGYGRGEGGNPMGRRTKETQDFESLSGVGLEMVWGCRATQDTNDMVNGYVLYEAAYNPPGFPEITTVAA